MHNITKVYCTQYTHYTVSPKLTTVQVIQTCRDIDTVYTVPIL